MKNWFLATVLLLSGAASAQNLEEGRGIRVGGDQGMDACGGYGITLAEVVMFVWNPGGHWEYEVVPANTGVYFCDSQKAYEGAEYEGVVVEDKNKSCGVSGPIAKEQDYKGPCKSGWISKIFLAMLAG